MKILQLNPAFYPAFSYGGTVNVAYNLSKALAKRGHDVTVYTSDTVDKDSRQTLRLLEHEGMKIHYFRNISNLLAWHRYLFYPGLIYELKNNIKDFDIVHLHGTRNFQNIVTAYYAKKNGIPYVVQPHGSAPALFQKQRIKRLFDKVVGNSILQNASLLLALTESEKQQLISIGVDPHRIEIMGNGVDTNDLLVQSKHGSFRRELNLTNEPLILYLARFHSIKGPDLLVKAFAKVMEELPRAHLAMVGPDDGYLNNVKIMVKELGIENNIIFYGPIYDDIKKIEAYSDADVYVLASRYETFPVSILEAWMAGTPVIISDRCGIKDDIGDCGLIVSFDVDDLSNAIKVILNDSNKSTLMGQRGKEKVTKQYSWHNIAEQLENKYVEVIIRGLVEKPL